MYRNVQITTSRAAFTSAGPAAGATGPAQPYLTTLIDAHIEALPQQEMLALREAGIRAKYVAYIDDDFDILPGDVITSIVDIRDGQTPWPSPVFGPSAIAQETWTVSMVNPAEAGATGTLLVYIDRDRTGGPEAR